MKKDTESLCECLDRGHDSGDGIHCLCGGVMPRAAWRLDEDAAEADAREGQYTAWEIISGN